MSRDPDPYELGCEAYYDGHRFFGMLRSPYEEGSEDDVEWKEGYSTTKYWEEYFNDIRGGTPSEVFGRGNDG